MIQGAIHFFCNIYSVLSTTILCTTCLPYDSPFNDPYNNGREKRNKSRDPCCFQPLLIICLWFCVVKKFIAQRQLLKNSKYLKKKVLDKRKKNAKKKKMINSESIFFVGIKFVVFFSLTKYIFKVSSVWISH